MSEPSESGATEVPLWLGEAIRQSVDELRAFFRTAYEATVRPKKLAATWSIGKRRPLNPVAFLATSLALTGTAQHFIALARGETGGNTSLLDEIIVNAFPYAAYLGVGLICHLLVFRRGQSVPLRGTLGVALYAGGGPAALPRFFDDVFFPAFGDAHQHVHEAIDVVCYVVFMLAFSDAVLGLHRVRRWRAVLAVLVSFVVIGTAGGLFVYAARDLRSPPTVGRSGGDLGTK